MYKGGSRRYVSGQGRIPEAGLNQEMSRSGVHTGSQGGKRGRVTKVGEEGRVDLDPTMYHTYILPSRSTIP